LAPRGNADYSSSSLRFDEVARIEAFGEPAVARGEEVARFGALALIGETAASGVGSSATRRGRGRRPPSGTVSIDELIIGVNSRLPSACPAFENGAPRGLRSCRGARSDSRGQHAYGRVDAGTARIGTKPELSGVVDCRASSWA